MIISVNPNPTLSEFQNLMKRTDSLLNSDASKRPEYYAARNGNPLEDDVVIALEESAKGTAFEKTIEKISGQRFPDIIASNFYGIEVKSTKENRWTSTGSSILETTRMSDVKRIYMTFGKLGGNPIEFLSKPYEECLYAIAVTHMPRYLIDMRLEKGDTIFDKIGIPYDELRQMDNPIAPVTKYYRSQLRQGESLWWAGEFANETVSATIRLWENVPADERRLLSAYGCVNFPEIFGGNYNRYALWLSSQGVVDTHIRDQFSAGGKETMDLPDGSRQPFPGAYRRIKDNKNNILHFLRTRDPEIPSLLTPDNQKLLEERIISWCSSVSENAKVNYGLSMKALLRFFFKDAMRPVSWDLQSDLADLVAEQTSTYAISQKKQISAHKNSPPK